MTADAELQEKSAADVKFIVDMLLSQCSQAVKEHEEKMRELTSQTPTEPADADRMSIICDASLVTSSLQHSCHASVSR